MRLQHHKIKCVDDLKPYVTDGRLDNAIGSLIGTFDPVVIEKWKEDNASDLKRISYPDPAEALDGLAKYFSTDAVLQTEGLEQLSAYSNKCLVVKKRFKKGKVKDDRQHINK